MKLTLYKISRKDPKDRCGKCLLPFLTKVRSVKYKVKGLSRTMERFPRFCFACKCEIEKEMANNLTIDKDKI